MDRLQKESAKRPDQWIVARFSVEFSEPISDDEAGRLIVQVEGAIVDGRILAKGELAVDEGRRCG
jgi:hypothetical protein